MSRDLFYVIRGKLYFNERIKKLIKDENSEEIKSLVSITDFKEQVDDNCLTLLLLATMHNNIEMIEYFISLGCDVNAKDLFGRTSLMIATENRYVDAMKVLIDANADMFIPEQKEKHPLQVYLQGTFIDNDIVEYFLQNMRKSKCSDEEVVEKLIRTGCQLEHIVCLDNVELTKIFLDRASMIESSHERRSVEVAMARHDVENIRVLLDYGDRAYQRKLDFFDCLYEATVCNNSHYIYKFDNLKMIRLCANLIVDWNLLDENTVTIIQYIVENSHGECLASLLQSDLLSYLMENEFEFNLPLHCFGNPDPKVIEWIQNQPIDIHTTSTDGQTALLIAVIMKNAENVRFLLKMGLNPIVRDKYEQTPIFYAFDEERELTEKQLDCNKECVRLLIQHGADLQVCNRNGFTFIEYVPFSDDKLEIFTKRCPSIIAHFSVLAALDLPINESIKNYLHAPYVQDYYEGCLQHLEKMKTHTIFGKLTLFQILTTNYEELSYELHSLDEEMLTVLFRHGLDEYDAYTLVMRERISKAMMLRTLRNETMNFIQDSIPKLKCYYPVLYKIVSYLNDSLASLVEYLYVNDESDDFNTENLNRCELFYKDKNT